MVGCVCLQPSAVNTASFFFLLVLPFTTTTAQAVIKQPFNLWECCTYMCVCNPGLSFWYTLMRGLSLQPLLLCLSCLCRGAWNRHPLRHELKHDICSSIEASRPEYFLFLSLSLAYIPPNLFWWISFPLNSSLSQWFPDGDLSFHILLHELKTLTHTHKQVYTLVNEHPDDMYTF